MKRIAAYTLIEIPLVVAIVAILSILVVPFALDMVQTTRGKNMTKQVTYAIFDQQQEAFNRSSNKSYGIAFYNTYYILYTGTSLASAESKETVTLDGPVTVVSTHLSGGSNEITFSTGDLHPSQSGTITLQDTIDTYTIRISPEGVIAY